MNGREARIWKGTFVANRDESSLKVRLGTQKLRFVNRERKATVSVRCLTAYLLGLASLKPAGFDCLKTRDRRESLAGERRKEDVCRAAVEMASVNIRV